MKNPNTRRIRRDKPQQRKPVVAPVVVEEELDDLDELLDDDDDDDDQPVTRMSRTLPDAPDEDDDENGSGNQRVIVRKMNVPTKPMPGLKQAVNEELETLSNPLPGIMEALTAGQTLVVERRAGKKWYVSFSTTNTLVEAVAEAALPKAKKLSRTSKEFLDIVLSPEYQQWQEDWQGLSYEEKLKKAKKSGAKWDEHEDARVNLMKLTTAYLEKTGIRKYKPEYQERAARDALVS